MTICRAVSPAYAVISVGEHSYGHPSDEVLARLAAVGAKIYRTDKAGTVVIISDGETMHIRTSLTGSTSDPVPFRSSKYHSGGDSKCW